MKGYTCLYRLGLYLVDKNSDITKFSDGWYYFKEYFSTIDEARSFAKNYVASHQPLEQGEKYLVTLSKVYVSDLEDF